MKIILHYLVDFFFTNNWTLIFVFIFSKLEKQVLLLFSHYLTENKKQTAHLGCFIIANHLILYVDMWIPASSALCLTHKQANELHSSFVVFYFVFVLRLPPDVNHGAIVFFYNSHCQRKQSGKSLSNSFSSCVFSKMP